MNNIEQRTSDNLRILIASMVEQSQSGHPGGAMGGADFISVLYNEFLNFNPNDMAYPFRDRFFLDPGHMSTMLYSTLALYESFSIEDLKNFRKWGSATPGHPEKDHKRGIENTSGPLGQGHTMAVGAAIAEKYITARFGKWMSHKIYAYISDGGIQEEISQGAGRIAGDLGLNNLIMFYDSNDIQLSTKVSEITSENVKKKYEAWNWNVLEIDGNNHSQIRQALQKANSEAERPTLIIGKTIMGKGSVDENCKTVDGICSLHGQPISKAGASYSKTIEYLGGDASNPFAIFDDVKDYIHSQKKIKNAWVEDIETKRKEWTSKNPELSNTLDSYISGKSQNYDFSSVSHKANIATREASGNILSYLGDIENNMIVMSADLANSDKTDQFLKKTKVICKSDFSGRFLQVGVSELTMATLANGMALHGGVVPVCSTFFVFSDYMKPAIRLSALMELPVKYVFTHDSFAVGEDGPTHQPIEHEAQMKLLEKLKNHSGNNSIMLFRPADAHETSASWKFTMENNSSPSVMILSRQNITTLPDSSYVKALEIQKGAYIAYCSDKKPEITLLASGSDVSILVDVVKQTNLKAQVVSMPSEGLFSNADEDYKDEIIPKNLPLFILTSGLPATFEGVTSGRNAKIFGLNHFGYSAPFEVLCQKFGFTIENIGMEIHKLFK